MNIKPILVIILTVLFLYSCKQISTPKPYGYHRIDFPEKEYELYSPDQCPFTFEKPVYSDVQPSNVNNAEPCWYNINFPEYNGVIHLSYKVVEQNLNAYIEDARELTYKHSVKADAISEQKYVNSENDVYGILYRVRGEAASSLQFFVTDSNMHFLRGALYFNVHPNMDSLAPVIDFFGEDVVHLMNTFRWE